MLVPHEKLQKDTLLALIEDFVTREGTDNGDETPVDIKIQRVYKALDSGNAAIIYDEPSQQCQLVLKRDIPKAWLNE